MKKSTNIKKVNTTLSKLLIPIFFVLVAFTNQANAQQWLLAGNNNATATSILGTTTPVSLKLYANNKNRMIFKTGGNTGIGTTNPISNYGLHVLGGVSRVQSPGLYLERSDLGGSNQDCALGVNFSSSLFSGATIGGGSCGFILYPSVNTPSPDMAFSTNSVAPQLIIKSNGNVGIGTSNPLQKLHINNGGIMISGTTAGYGGPQLIFSDDVNTTPNGRWAIEYLSAASSRPNMGGLNFWKPFPDAGGAGNYSLFLKDDGKIGMGVTDDNGDSRYCANPFPNNYRLYVNGGILTTKIKIANYCSSSWADYVFAPDYKLMPLNEIKSYVATNKHLPDVPSADSLEKEGLDLASMAALQMQKIEELTLHLINMNERLEKLEKENAALKAANTNSPAK